MWKIRELLRDGRLRIPDYQRPYAWSTQNVAELVDDIRQFTPSGDYRIGTVILHGHDDHGEQVLDVVDGQQRLTTLHLLAWALRATGSDPTARDVARLRLSPFGAEQTASRARENAAFLARLVSEWEPDAVQEFANAVFLQCEVVVVTLASLDEAFQMFDSQNARGRALYPTDLLKAFHLREIGSGLRDAATKREVVELWEDIPAAHVNALFSEYLFKIRRWSGGRDVPKEGFTTSDIGMFKGIRERDVTNSENNWARPFVYAKNFTDDYRSENSTLVRFRMLEPIEYPHQIDQPVLNGETFFRMVWHYYRLGVRLGLLAFSDDKLLKEFQPALGEARSTVIDAIDKQGGLARGRPLALRVHPGTARRAADVLPRPLRRTGVRSVRQPRGALRDGAARSELRRQARDDQQLRARQMVGRQLVPGGSRRRVRARSLEPRHPPAGLVRQRPVKA